MREILLLLCIPFVGIAQTDYELEFNSAAQDYVQMPNTSVIIANKTAFSMSCWVYPEANTNHGGIIGFRNNTDADFYLLQMQNTNTIEARFRNSSGVNYDIVAANALDFNQWQHLAFTYDGSYIRLYKNGIIVNSTIANGTITQSTQSFNLGALDWQGSLFHLNGRLDEIRLWDVALSQTEINSWMCTPIDLTHPNYNNLIGYWRLNDGQGLIAYDQTANGNNGTLMGGAQWQTATSCFGSTSPLLTYVPDNNFEAYLEINGMGNGIPYDDSVFTSAIDTLTYLDISFGAGSATGIFDLTGIEDFNNLLILDCSVNNLTSIDMSNNTSLTYLNCRHNQLNTLDVSNNISLIELNVSQNQIIQLNVSSNAFLKNLNCAANQLQLISVINNQMLTNFQCQGNQLTSLDLSNNIMLDSLACLANQLTNLDLSNNINLIALSCGANQLTTLNISNNINLQGINCDDNDLVSLDLRNGSNQQLGLSCTQNLQLSCIDVDDVAWSTSNWTVVNSNIDSQHYFSNNCNGTAIQEHATNKELLKTIDLLGREIEGEKKEPLFYIYDDGTVKKKIIIE